MRHTLRLIFCQGVCRLHKSARRLRIYLLWNQALRTEAYAKGTNPHKSSDIHPLA